MSEKQPHREQRQIHVLSAATLTGTQLAELEITVCKHVEGTEQRENMELTLRIRMIYVACNMTKGQTPCHILRFIRYTI